MHRIFVSGANGFIGRALCIQLSTDNTIIGVDVTRGANKSANISCKRADLNDWESVAPIFEKRSPDVLIHCAGIAHQKIGSVDLSTYMRVNSEVTENLAKNAARANPDVCFVFLSSISVYGEGRKETGVRREGTEKIFSRKGAMTQKGDEFPQIKRSDKNSEDGVGEDSECLPSSDYAVSKLDAERRLCVLYDEGILRNLFILRLAPVYDRGWSLNLNRRIYAPGKMAYVRFGSGLQRMSALARPNLVEFIEFLINTFPQNKKDVSRKGAKAQRREKSPQVSENENNLSNRLYLQMNVCDAEAYDFNRIIEVFRKSVFHPNKPVISVPLSPVWIATRVAGAFFPGKKSWFHSCYDKLASDLVFDNRRMLETGFRPRHSLETIFSSIENRKN